MQKKIKEPLKMIKKIFNNSLRSNLIGTDSNFHSTNETLNFFKRNNIKEIQKFGSSLKYAN